MEDVVAEDKACGVIADEVPADDECLCEAVGRWLFGVGEPDSVVAAVAKQSLESGEVSRGRDDQYIPDSGQHEGRNGIVDHWFVIDWEHLFRYPLGDGVEACARPTGKYDSFHYFDN